jgi:sugar fermentation stimulation protein A
LSLFIETIPGIFIAECKNRFLSKVKVADEIVECYVPNSSRIENYMQVDGCQALLTGNISKNSRTRYSLFAVKYENNYVILNLNKVNSIMEQFVNIGLLYSETKYKVYREKTIEGAYKSDLYLSDLVGDNNIIIEAKAIIATDRIVEFPQVFSERSLKQLEIIYRLLKNGSKIHYFLVCLSPLIHSIKLNCKSEYVKLLKRCIKVGLELKTLTLYFDGEKIAIKEGVEISFY